MTHKRTVTRVVGGSIELGTARERFSIQINGQLPLKLSPVTFAELMKDLKEHDALSDVPPEVGLNYNGQITSSKPIVRGYGRFLDFHLLARLRNISTGGFTTFYFDKRAARGAVSEYQIGGADYCLTRSYCAPLLMRDLRKLWSARPHANISTTSPSRRT